MESNQKRWAILDMINWLTTYLSKKGIDEARLNAEHLIAYTLKIKRMDLYLQYDRPLTGNEKKNLKVFIKRRVKREPLQYILGTQPFRNVELKVDSNVLIPRPETEQLVEIAINTIPKKEKIKILELGVGSGAISLALASELSDAVITGTEISDSAIKVAEENISEYKDRINIIKGDLFQPLNEDDRFDLIISNPPYIPTKLLNELEPEIVEFEPVGALDGGKDGLDFYRRIFNTSSQFLEKNGILILEMGEDQQEAINSLAKEYKWIKNIDFHPDLTGKIRILSIKNNEEDYG